MGTSDASIDSKITSATIYEVTYVLATPYKLSYGTLESIDAVILKLTDGDGFVGWGEANPQPGFTDESCDDVVAMLKEELLPLVLGREGNPERLDALLDGHKAGHLISKGSISMALLDLWGKRHSRRTAESLGSIIHSSLPVLWPLNNGTAAEDARVIDPKITEGYRSFMLKMGSPGAAIRDEIRRVASLRERYGDTIKLIADANTGWTNAQALEFVTGVDTNIVFLEQPMHKADILGMADLSKQTTIPLSVDESLTSLDSANRIAELGAATVFSIKSSKNGGPLRARALSNLAAKHGIHVYFNSMLEGGITQAASLQHAVTVSNLVDAGHAFMSTRRLVNDPTNFSSFVRRGIVHLPEGPGLGIEVDETKVREMARQVHVL